MTLSTCVGRARGSNGGGGGVAATAAVGEDEATTMAVPLSGMCGRLRLLVVVGRFEFVGLAATAAAPFASAACGLCGSCGRERGNRQQLVACVAQRGGGALTCCRKLVGFLGTCGGTLGGASVGVARLRVEAPAKLLRLLGDGGGRGCSTSGGGGGGSGSSKV